MKTIIMSVMALTLTFSSACGNKRKNKDKSNQMEQTNQYKTEKGSTVWVMLVDMNEKYPSDPFTLIDAHVDDMNILHLTVEYSGGCNAHEFKVLGSNAILKSLPAQRPVIITHNANGDACRSIVREQILVDISDFSYSKVQDSEIILLLDGQRISYKYQATNSSDK